MTPQRRSRIRQRGFSFIEVLCGVFLVACCASIVSAAMPVATVGRTKSAYVNTATSVAQRQIEEARAVGYANLNGTSLFNAGIVDNATPLASGAFSFTATDSDAGDNVSRVLPGGQGTLRVEQVDQDLRRVTVVVTWVERGITRTYTVGTLVANI
jgi:Tfp pilus assembly protein PilV